MGTYSAKSIYTIEDITGKEENAGNQHFFLFPIMFSNSLFFRILETKDRIILVGALPTVIQDIIIIYTVSDMILVW